MGKSIGNACRAELMWLLLLLLLLAIPGTGICALDPSTAYFFAATGYNSTGLESVDFSLVRNDEPTPQTVTITPPSTEEVAEGIVPVRVFTPQDITVARVQFFVNGVLNYEAVADPFRITWNTSVLVPGTYVLSVKVFDADGSSVASDDLEVTVAGDSTPPSVLLSGPGNTSTVKGTVSFSAGAQDNATVTRVELYLDGNLLASSSQSSISYQWNTALVANGGHVLSAKAFDAAGNVGESNLLTVSVLNDAIPPVVALLSPVATSTVSGTVALSATATDDVAVAKVEFYVNGALQGTTTSAPYQYDWNTVALPNGVYTLQAKAYDTAGNAGVSMARSVSVFYDRAAPTITAFALPEIYDSTTVPITAVDATDVVAVTGYLVTETATAPLATAAGWSATAPTSFTFSGTGSRTAYAWAKDAAGNVSLAKSATTIIDTELPIITSMTLGTSGKTVTLRVAASDNVALNRIEVYLDNVLQVTNYTSPVTYSWEGSRSQILTVKVFDKAGNVRTRSLKVSRN